MPCFKPSLAHHIGYNADGSNKYKFYGNLASFGKDYDYSRYPNDVLVPCKKCVGCRLDYSRDWAGRLMLELDHSKTALFLTLTYSPDDVVIASYDEMDDIIYHTLVKRHCQLFLKRLRKFFEPRKLRFYLSGEYGTSSLRPHYHAIIFGLSLDDFPDSRLLFTNQHHQPIYTSRKLEDIWTHGLVSFGAVSWQSCAYVARYALKKLNHGNDDFFENKGCVPEFSVMSRNLGIGRYYLQDHPDFLWRYEDFIYIEDPYGVKTVNKIQTPKFIFDEFCLRFPEESAIIKEKKKLALSESYSRELSNTNLTDADYQFLKACNLYDSTKSLLRTV